MQLKLCLLAGKLGDALVLILCCTVVVWLKSHEKKQKKCHSALSSAHCSCSDGHALICVMRLATISDIPS